jgi:hypothetical protein
LLPKMLQASNILAAALYIYIYIYIYIYQSDQLVFLLFFNGEAWVVHTLLQRNLNLIFF